MHVEELLQAVGRIATVLNKSDIQSAVRQYRAATGDDRSMAAARLAHAGEIIVAHTAELDRAEKAVVQCMHLESLTSADYWRSLLESTDDTRKTTAELVHLYSRAMFASTHLPNLVALLEGTDDNVADTTPVSLESGQRCLAIVLTDAGERAGHPDRVARAIDGVDMLYSACASIARKTAMELQLHSVSGSASRDVRFIGDGDSLLAVADVLRSIPSALARFDDDEDIDLDRFVDSLPVFDALNELAAQPGLGERELVDIHDTMHQGILLSLESGVVLHADSVGGAGTSAQAAAVPGDNAAAAESGSAADDEHYQHYLKERAALLAEDAGKMPPVEDQRRRDAVDSLLRNLGQARVD